MVPFNRKLIGGLPTSYVTHIRTNAFWIDPPSPRAQNWRVAGVDNMSASGLS